MLRYSCCRALVRGIFRALPRTTMLVASIPALPKLQPTPVLEAVNFMIRDVARAAAVLPVVPSVPVVPTRSPAQPVCRGTRVPQGIQMGANRPPFKGGSPTVWVVPSLKLLPQKTPRNPKLPSVPVVPTRSRLVRVLALQPARSAHPYVWLAQANGLNVSFVDVYTLSHVCFSVAEADSSCCRDYIYPSASGYDEIAHVRSSPFRLSRPRRTG